MRLIARSLIATAFLIASSAGAEKPITVDEVTGPITWGSAENVTHVRHLWFSGQPDRAGFGAAKAAGVKVVINLRDPKEFDLDERVLVEELGMLYYNVPVDGKAFDREAFERIESILEGGGHEQTLLHCSSSNRVGGWLATHLVEKHRLSKDAALEIGRKTGITKSVIEASVKTYLGSEAQ